jgi:hypothetical protein
MIMSNRGKRSKELKAIQEIVKGKNLLIILKTSKKMI